MPWRAAKKNLKQYSTDFVTGSSGKDVLALCHRFQDYCCHSNSDVMCHVTKSLQYDWTTLDECGRTQLVCTVKQVLLFVVEV